VPALFLAKRDVLLREIALILVFGWIHCLELPFCGLAQRSQHQVKIQPPSVWVEQLRRVARRIRDPRCFAAIGGIVLEVSGDNCWDALLKTAAFDQKSLRLGGGGVR
jgi:hypothetical protein